MGEWLNVQAETEVSRLWMAVFCRVRQFNGRGDIVSRLFEFVHRFSRAREENSILMGNISASGGYLESVAGYY
jgi:hypothetical protein